MIIEFDKERDYLAEFAYIEAEKEQQEMEEFKRKPAQIFINQVIDDRIEINALSL